MLGGGKCPARVTLLLLLLLKSVELDDDVALLLSVAGLVVGPRVTSESVYQRHRLCCTEDIVDLSSALWKLCYVTYKHYIKYKQLCIEIAKHGKLLSSVYFANTKSTATVATIEAKRV